MGPNFWPALAFVIVAVLIGAEVRQYRNDCRAPPNPAALSDPLGIRGR
jgi:hypothetical protein